MVLGAFEIVLGVVVLVWRDEFGLFFYSVVTVWAFAAALVLLREALRQRAQAKARVVN
jgi:drug/metabolite transporter (DMT)-like permease